jgi:hypothetical protein
VKVEFLNVLTPVDVTDDFELACDSELGVPLTLIVLTGTVNSRILPTTGQL